jgi:DNA-binding response OmpR family regulator
LPPKILLVDDEKDYVLTLSERLQLREMEVDAVFDGEQALEYLERELPHVILLDLRMPGMGGMEVLRQVRRRFPQVAVVILTGHGSEKDRQEALELGAVDYLQKPVDIGVLAPTLRRACEPPDEPE